MTSKIYRSAQGKSVDLGTIMLQNEHVRAVGNMNVNARGDKLDSNNQVIETKSRQIQKQNDRTSTNVSAAPVQSSSKKSRSNSSKSKQQVSAESQINTQGSAPQAAPAVDTVPAPVSVPESKPVQHVHAPSPQEPKQQTIPPAVVKPPVQQTVVTTPPPAPSSVDTQQTTSKGGLAGAIARTREIKQELDRTRRQQAQDQGVRKI